MASPPPCPPARSVVAWCRLVVRAALILSINLYAAAAYLCWLVVLLPLRLCAADAYWYLETRLFSCLQALVAQWMWSAGYVVADVGEDISAYADEECLLLVNHQSTGDVPVIMTCLQDKGDVSGSVLWVIDSLFRYTHFGICSTMRGDYFISTGKKGRQQQLVDFKRHVTDVFTSRSRKWLILFPEGGFLRKRKATSQAYAKKNDFPYLEHVTLPRLGAMQTILEVLSPNSPVTNGVRRRPLKWVVDVTIGYADGRPLDVVTLLTAGRPPCRTDVHCRVYPADTVPVCAGPLRDWLFERYAEKDRLLAHFYRTGSFPAPPPAPRRYGPAFSRPEPVEFSVVTAAWQNALFVGSLYVQYHIARGVACVLARLVAAVV